MPKGPILGCKSTLYSPHTKFREDCTVIPSHYRQLLSSISSTLNTSSPSQKLDYRKVYPKVAGITPGQSFSGGLLCLLFTMIRPIPIRDPGSRLQLTRAKYEYTRLMFEAHIQHSAISTYDFSKFWSLLYARRIAALTTTADVEPAFVFTRKI